VKNERTSMVVFPVFNGYNIEVVVAKDVKKAWEKRKKDYTDYEGNFSAIHSSNEFGQACIILPTGCDLALVAHECCHATLALTMWANAINEETTAYHMGYLTKQVYDFVRSRSKRTRT
jgi:hypothetical protein